MLRVDRAVVDAVNGATSTAELVRSVKDAVRLEFATIPPYLTAMLSLKPTTNRPIWWAIHDVVVDEMLHMLIGCNLLSALGARPALDAPDFVMTYPDRLPLGVAGGMQVGLVRFSEQLVREVFMEIEEPEHPLVFRSARDEAGGDEATIGEFYRALRDAVLALPASELHAGDLPGDSARQVAAPRWFPAERLFPIRTPADAARAIELIIEEGEGSPDSPVDPDGDIAHYYRFEAIAKGQALVRDSTAPLGFSFSGAPYDFQAAGVWPLAANQKHEDLDPGSVPWARVQQFRVLFTRLLDGLQQVVDGHPDTLDDAMGLMFELKFAGQALAATPLSATENVGPVFVRAPVNR